MQKKSVLFLLLLFVASFMFAQTNRLENYQVAAFGGVTRVSLTFTQRPITNVLKESNNLKVTIQVPSCELGNVPARFTTPDMFANVMIISRPSRDITIEITTNQIYEQIKQSSTQGRQYTVHIDIIKTLNPQRIEDIVSLLDYYHYIGNREALNELMQTSQEMFPNHTQLVNRRQNRFNPPTIYSPRTTRPSVAQTTPTQRPQTQTTTTQTPPTTTPQRPPAQPPIQTPENRDLPVTITPEPPIQQPTQVTTPVALPQSQESRNINPNDVSFTLITRNDRFPTRIPQTKPLFSEPIRPPEPEPEIIRPPDPEPEPEPEPVTPPDPEPIRQPDPEPIPEPIRPPDPEPIQQQIVEIIREPVIIYRSVSDTTGLTETEKLFLSYYRVASADSILLAFLIGASANIVGDFQTAIQYLSLVPFTDINYEDAIEFLHDSYSNIGDTQNANFYASLLQKDDDEAKDTRFINTPIALWMAGVLGGLALLIGFTIAIISLGAKKSKNKTMTEQDYSAHVSNIQRAYDRKPFDAPSQTVEEIEKTESLSFHYDNPPIITEELTPQETKELVEDENVLLEIKKPTTPENTSKPPPEEENEYENFADEEYKKNLVLKLYKDGWKMEEIAKELQMSQREIDFIIRISN